MIFRLVLRLTAGFAVALVVLTPAAGTLLFAPVSAVSSVASSAGATAGTGTTAGTTGAGTSLDRLSIVDRYVVVQGAMIAAGAPYAGWATTPGREFLDFDGRGDGRIVEVVGDLARAERIAVLVPGVDTRLGNYAHGLGGVADRSPLVQAHRLLTAAATAGSTGSAVPAGSTGAAGGARAADATGTAGAAGGARAADATGTAAGERLAVVAWLGYDTPDGVGPAAIREEYARAGASALDDFVSWLARVRPTARISVLGHSYGSVVAGLAARHLPDQVTDIVAFGSPGMGVSRAADLRTHARIWAGRADGDWIRWIPGIRILGAGHGTKPTSARFGAHRFGTRGATGHDHYLSPGTESLTNIAAIATGRYAEVRS